MEIVKNVTKMANRGKTWHIDSVNRSKNVVGIGVFTTLHDTSSLFYLNHIQDRL